MPPSKLIRRRRPPPPQAIDRHASAAGLRTVAVFEAVKGLVVLALGLGLLSMIHRDVQQAAEEILVHLHVNPDRRLGHALLHAASTMTDGRLWALAGAAAAYAAVRFTEAWGLWHRRIWAEWFALLSGALYLPWEILKMAERVNWLHAGMLTANLAILAYMAYIRVEACWPIPCEE